jgi:hypothetical protein
MIKTAFEKQRLPPANNGAQIRNPNTRLPLPFMRNVECWFLFHTLMQLKYPEQRGMGGQVEMRNNIKIRKSNDQNISGAYTIFTGFFHVLNLGFMSFVFVSARPGATWFNWPMDNITLLNLG